MKYSNLDLELFDYQAANNSEQFHVRVAASPTGEQKLTDAEVVSMQPQLRAQLAQLDARALHKQEIKALGTDLAALLFPPHVRDFLLGSWRQLKEDEGLRIRLKFDTYALADLPWEYVYLSQLDDGAQSADGFLVLNRRLSLVRYEVLGQPPGSLAPIGNSPLRMVVLLANPKSDEYPPLHLDRERTSITEATTGVTGLDPAFYDNATVDTLEEALLQQTQIFHFAGHGVFKGDLKTSYGETKGAGFIVLMDKEQEAVLFSAEQLVVNLRDRGIRLAMLGACEAGRRDAVNPWTGVVPALTRAGIPAVMGMQYTVGDGNAQAFSKRFYAALVQGQSVDAAMTNGRIAIFNRSDADERDWGVPVLYLRAVEDVLFPKTQVTEADSTWEDVVGQARTQSNSVILAAQGTPGHLGAFVPQLYVQRAAEATLQTFLDSPATAAVVVGDSGSGKSNLLYHWASSLATEGHAVLLYSCGSISTPQIETAIAQDLGVKSADDVLSGLERVASLATKAGRQFVLIFDALNEFRGSAQTGPEDLFKNMVALVKRLPAQGVRVVLSCTTSAWNQLDRATTTPLLDQHFFRFGDVSVLTLDLFTPQEFDAGYDHYRSFFHLQTPVTELPSALRERLHKPLLLRMLAESFQNRAIPAAMTDLSSIFGQYYQQRVRSLRDRVFVDNLAGEMLRRQTSSLRVDDLVRIDSLKSEILASDPNASYYSLLDNGILTETSGDPIQGDTVAFTYNQVGAYALARYIIQHGGTGLNMQSTVVALVKRVTTFPLAWDVARTLLLISQKDDLIISLATTTDVTIGVELRELVVESLVEIFADAPEVATNLIKALLTQESVEARRTGLKATYQIGPGARSIFIWAATNGSPALREALKYTLYLIWRSDPAFTFDLLTELESSINVGPWSALQQLLQGGSDGGPLAIQRNIVEVVVNVPITIYINHCEQPELIQQITNLHGDMMKNKLHLNLLNTAILGSSVEQWVMKIAVSSFAQPVMDTMLLTDVNPAANFFNLSVAERARLKGLARVMQPQAELAPHLSEIQALLNSEVLFFQLAAVTGLAIHSYSTWETTELLVRQLFNDLNPTGRLLLVLSFAVLLPATPPAWLGFLEEMTKRLWEEHPQLFYDHASTLLDLFDVVFLPLGLAYGKHGGEMSYFAALLQDGVSRKDQRQIIRCIAGLTSVGFYHPEAVLQTLRSNVPDLCDPALRPALVKLLATMRVLYFDGVDLFLRQIGADEAFQLAVSMATDVGLVQHYISWLGLYNNAVHGWNSYPVMRRVFLAPIMDLLADATSAEDFVTRFSMMTLHALRDADYQFTKWTLLEGAA